MSGSIMTLGCSSPAMAASSSKADKKLWRQGNGKSVAKGKYDPQTSLAPVLEQIQPTVVSIRTSASDTHARFPSRHHGGMGSGFIISKDGLVVTNNHVVASGDHFQVRLADERVFDAHLLGRDPATDIALLQLEDAKNLPTAVFGVSKKTKVGDWVIAVGSPIGLEQTVTRGIVSAKGRGGLGLYRDGYVDFLQTDAAINPGNSGGPLFNLRGEVIGMNTAISGIGSGLGFAVPVDQIKQVLPQLHSHGHVARGWLGVAGQDVTPAQGTTPLVGAVIGIVYPDTPAARSGLRTGDRVVSVDGKRVKNFNDLHGRIGNHSPKDTLSLKIEREGHSMKISVPLGKRPSANTLSRMSRGGSQGLPTPGKGAHQGSLYGDDGPALGVEVEGHASGVTIRRVRSHSVADRLGLRAQDVLREINGRSISNIQDVRKALSLDATQVRVVVERGKGTHSAMLQIQSSKRSRDD